MNTRRNFLLTSSVFALAPAIANADSSSPKSQPAKDPALTFSFDRPEFEKILEKRARHKQCFAATKISPEVIFAMKNSMDAYESYLKEGPGAMHAVAVFYHGLSIALAFDDALWNEYLVPLFNSKQYVQYATPEERAAVAKLTLGKGNPFLHSKTSNPDDVSIERLVSRGSSFFVCHNAIVGLVDGIADVVKQPAQKIHAAILQGIVPGALAVPAGVMAINACQEAKFTYIQCSV